MSFYSEIKSQNAEICDILDGRTVTILGKQISAIILSEQEILVLSQGDIEGTRQQIRIDYDDEIGPLIDIDTRVEIDGIEYRVKAKSLDAMGMMTLSLKRMG